MTVPELRLFSGRSSLVARPTTTAEWLPSRVARDFAAETLSGLSAAALVH